MIPGLSHTRFERSKAVFRRTVEKSPVRCVLRVATILPTEDKFSQFVGDSPRSYRDFTFQCLDRREFTEEERTRFGLYKKTTGMIWLAPDHLVDQIGYWELDSRLLTVFMHGFQYKVNKVTNKAPFYNSCYSVELQLAEPNDT